MNFVYGNEKTYFVDNKIIYYDILKMKRKFYEGKCEKNGKFI